MYDGATQAMAQFVLKIEKLPHIMGAAPIVELVRAYGLHPWLWLLMEIIFKSCKKITYLATHMYAWWGKNFGVFLVLDVSCIKKKFMALKTHNNRCVVLHW